MRHLFILLIPLSFKAHAGLPAQLSATPCRFQMEDVLKKYKSLDDWKRSVDPSPRSFAFSSKTSVTDRTVEVQSLSSPYVFIFDKKKTIIHRWDAKTCIKALVAEAKPPKNIVPPSSPKPECAVTDYKPLEIDATKICNNLVTPLSSPVLSPDGKEVATFFEGYSAIYKINPDHACEMILVLGYETTPLIFRDQGLVFKAKRTVVVNENPEIRNDVFILDRKNNEVRVCE